MGTSGQPHSRNISNIPNKINDASEEDDFYNCPNDQYLCPLCKNVPELVNIFTETGSVEFKCKDHGTIILTVNQYFEKMRNSEFTYYNFKCSNCHIVQTKCFKKVKELKDGIFKFCYICRKIYCQECCKSVIAHPKFHNDSCIDVNEMNTRCPDHFDEGYYTSFCVEDCENVCEKYSRKHRGHNIKSFFNIETKLSVIKAKNKILKDLIKFNELIMNTYRQHPDNYFHNINVKILAESIEAENSRNPKELENIFRELELNIKIKNDAIKEFKEKFKYEINGDEDSLILRNKGINDDALKILSKIKLYNLKEIDLSFNNIKNLEYLENFSTKFLETLSLNDNKIEDINVLQKLDLKNLKLLNLQNNIIKDVKPLNEVNMPVLELLRIEGNNDLKPSMEDMKKVIKKFSKQIIYVVKTLEDFSKKYNVDIQRETTKLNLDGNSKGNEILKDLYLTLPEINDLSELRLADCGIDDIFILSRLFLPKLEKIDLSFNKLIKIEALCNLRPNKLKVLYLNDNIISDISPLKRIKFYGGAGKITIENNNFILESSEVQNIIKDLENKKIKIKVKGDDED